MDKIIDRNFVKLQTAWRLSISQPLVFIGYGSLLLWVVWLYVRMAGMVGGAELAYSDPPAHFTSGVMVYEYLRTAFGADPIPFAESFYVRYPKVAIGQWPPAYYAIQSLWYLLFGVGIWTAQCLSVVTALCLAGLVYTRLYKGYGKPIALGMALLLLTLPLIQTASWQIMSDLLTGLFVFLALLAFANLLDKPGWRDGLSFMFWAVLAILTKGTAWALAPFVLIAPLLTGRIASYKATWYWGSGLLFAGLASVFFLVMQSKGMGYPINFKALLSRFTVNNLFSLQLLMPLQPFLKLLPTLAMAVMLLGFVDAFKSRWQAEDNSRETTEALLAATWIIAQAVFLLLLPLTGEERALIPALAPAILLIARALYRSKTWVIADKRHYAVIVIVGALFIGAGIAPANPVHGFAAAAQRIPYTLAGEIIMVSSDPAGEGAFIVERLVHDPNKAGIVLRAGQTLTESNWMGTVNRPIYQDPQAVLEKLESLAVRYLVLDRSVPKPTDDQRLLAAALAEQASAYQQLDCFPVADLRAKRQGDVCIYENPTVKSPHPQHIKVRLGLERGGRELEYLRP